MTRFARAKGSKSSNEKVPEDATPWSELKKGMIKKEEVSEETKKCVYNLKSETQENKPLEWVNFDDENDDCLNILKKHLQKKKKTGKTENYNSAASTQEINEEINGADTIQGEVKEIKQKKKKKKTEKTQDCNSASSIQEIKSEEINGADTIQGEVKEIKQKKKKKKVGKTENCNSESSTQDIKSGGNSNEETVQGEVQKIKKKKKRKLDEEEGNSQEETEEISKKKKMKTFSGEKSLKKKLKTAGKGQKNIHLNNGKHSEKAKKKKNPDELTIYIGGEMVEIEKFQGFYVTKEDAQRLKELRKKMEKEGISKTQIEGAIKLERRRCERTLSRMRKKVCFQCRKPGHSLSDCPMAQNGVETGTGVCYKCGSTEHNAFSCKVTKGGKYPFAECFICKEKGHIAKECPDNPRGLYPKGGCCRLCGDVTHLQKDCPKKQLEAEEKTIKLGLRDDRNLEGLDNDNYKFEPKPQKKQTKHIRF